MCSSAMINDGLTDIILLPRQHQGDHPGGALGATTDILPILPPNSPLDKPPFVHRPATDKRQPRVITCSRKCHPSFGWLQRTILQHNIDQSCFYVRGHSRPRI